MRLNLFIHLFSVCSVDMHFAHTTTKPLCYVKSFADQVTNRVMFGNSF